MGKFIDLTGQKFNSLTVIEKSEKRSSDGEIFWICRCDCGNPNLVEIRGSALRRGHTKTCGHCSAYQYIGKIFGKLEIIEEDPKDRTKFICKCKCGNIVSKNKSKVLSGHTQSCGCKQLDNSIKKMVGKRFGKLLVLEPSRMRTQKQEIIWKCQCDCGNITFAGTDILNKGQKNSCGCLKMSKGENAIKNLLEKYKIPFEQEKSFNEIKKYRFDFFVDNKYIIEFDGKQHFETKNSGWDTEEHLQKVQKNDNIKNNWCFSKNIPIIRIPYYHLDELTIEDLLLETTKFLIKD